MAAFRCPASGAWLVLMLLAVPASAGVRVVGPFPARALAAAGFEIGPSFSVSAPTGLAGEGFGRAAGVCMTFTSMQTRSFGLGLDLGYDRWPSPTAGAELDRLMTVFGRGTIRGTEVTLSALRAGAHFRVVPMPAARITPWIEAGFGVNRLNGEVEFPLDQLLAAGWSFGGGSGRDDIEYEPDFTGRVGIDLKTTGYSKVGLDASYRWIAWSGESEAFTTFSLGGRVMFGRW